MCANQYPSMSFAPYLDKPTDSQAGLDGEELPYSAEGEYGAVCGETEVGSGVSSEVVFHAADGFPLCGRFWHASIEQVLSSKPVVIINPATSVRARYYARFAEFLQTHGFDVFTYDYRGIGESRPASLRNFEAGWIDWGRQDFEAALRLVAIRKKGQPIYVVAHSVGGFLIGLAASSHLIKRVFTVGAQYAYWRDYAPEKRKQMIMKWHVVMPLLARLIGYFPGKHLGWLEDTPRGVVRDWTAPYPNFEDAWRHGSFRLSEAELQGLLERFAAVKGSILAVSFADDEFGTIPAIRRLLRYYHNSPKIHLHIEPKDIGLDAIGHFSFFHSSKEGHLWHLPLHWLRHGCLPGDVLGAVVTSPAQAQEFSEASK